MILEILAEEIKQNIGSLKPAPKGWLKRHCMLCHTQGHGKDTRNRFGIQYNPQNIVVNCFNCGFSATYQEGENLSRNFAFFLKQINIPDRFIEQVKFEIYRHKHQIQTVKEGEIETPERRLRSLTGTWTIKDLPDGSMSIKDWLEYGLDDPDFLAVAEYAVSRKIYDLDKFFWAPNKEFQLNNRLIVPYYYHGALVGFTSRYVLPDPEKKIPKYYQQSPTDFVYNLDNQTDWDRRYVIVNEGVLDAWFTDGVGILGEVNQNKIDLVNRLDKEIILCPDRDRKGSDLIKVAMENGWAVAFPRWGSIKDAAAAVEQYGRPLTIHSIIQSAIWDKDKIYLHWKFNERTFK